MSNSDYESLIRIYFEKSENIVRDRNNLITIFFSILFPVIIVLYIDNIFPSTYSGKYVLLFGVGLLASLFIKNSIDFNNRIYYPNNVF